jgi:enediyne biosynthesis protein CalE5
MTNQTSVGVSLSSATDQHRQREEPLRGINDQLFEHLGPLAEDALLLDLASGGGNPALAAAFRYPDAQILGVDADGTAVEMASDRAREAGLDNVTFAEMSVEHLELKPASVDAAISRLGLLLLGYHPILCATELARVLKPGSHFSVALWSDVDGNPYLRIGLQVLKQVMPPERVPTLAAHVAASGSSEVVEGWLISAGIRHVESAIIKWEARFQDAFAWWDYLATSGPFTPIFAELSDDERATARDLAISYVDGTRTNGEVVLQSRCRLIWGSR